MYFNSQGQDAVTYDAIVVGSGISGGWAARELCGKGLKTLVLERGRSVRHGEYPTAGLDPWDMPARDLVPQEELRHYAVQNRSGGRIRFTRQHWFVRDDEHPYAEARRFDWIRGYHTGGRSLMWGRHCYRLSDLDFEANAREGIGVDWPVRYADLAPWYDYVERFAGISGQAEGLPHLPDGVFQPAMPLNCVEQHLRERIAERFPGRVLTPGRVAHLTAPDPAIHGTRGKCQYRNRCDRGCPYGAYFSSNAATLPAAEATGNLTMRHHAVVHSILYDKANKRAAGVRIIDAETGATEEYFARVVFLCASTLGSTFILLHSVVETFPDGLGNTSGQLGRNLMDHHGRCGASGRYDGFEDQYYKGRKPSGIYLARYRNISPETRRPGYLRGYGYQGGAGRGGATRGGDDVKGLIGADLKAKLLQPGPWGMGLVAFGECLPYYENKVELDFDNRDPRGLPLLKIDATFRENEHAMRLDMAADAAEMLEAAGFKDVRSYNDDAYPGGAIHEMGTARMGRDPRTSVLNRWNQMHDVPNVFVTDGACMTSSGCQNPSLTYMALTARAADYAVSELKKGNL